MIEIRNADSTDAPLISLLGRITFCDTFEHLFRDRRDILDYCARTFDVAKIQKGILNSKNHFLIATYNDLPIGYAKLKRDSSNEFLESDSICQLQKIYVLKDFLAMKVGQKLQDEILQIAIRDGFKNIWLSVLNENNRAIQFYKKHQFEVIGNHDFTIGQELFHFSVMYKKLR